MLDLISIIEIDEFDIGNKFENDELIVHRWNDRMDTICRMADSENIISSIYIWSPFNNKDYFIQRVSCEKITSESTNYDIYRKMLEANNIW